MARISFDLKNALKQPHALIGWWWTKEKNFNDELNREVPIGHELYEQDVTIIAASTINDDCLYQFINDKRVARVHLTWRKSTEVLPFPASTIYQNLDEWYEKAYFPDLDIPLNHPESLNQFEQMVLGYALDLVSNQDFEQYIRHLDKNNLPFVGINYFELISLNFNEKQNVIVFLNPWYKRFLYDWYKKNYHTPTNFDTWCVDLVAWYDLQTD